MCLHHSCLTSICVFNIITLLFLIEIQGKGDLITYWSLLCIYQWLCMILNEIISKSPLELSSYHYQLLLHKYVLILHIFSILLHLEATKLCGSWKQNHWYRRLSLTWQSWTIQKLGECWRSVNGSQLAKIKMFSLHVSP